MAPDLKMTTNAPISARSLQWFSSVIVIALTILAYVRFMGRMQGRSGRSLDAHETDPSLLKQYSTFRSYSTSHSTYPSIRTFSRPHPRADRFSFPSYNPLPLLVFVHGLGGSLAQFEAILSGLTELAPCLGIDLPGCGRSEFAPPDWQSYTSEALAELVHVVIKQHQRPWQGYVLIAHSYGTSLSALLASSVSGGEVGSPEALGLVAICPIAEAPRGLQATIFKILLCVPTPIFDLWRAWDRRGGPDSASISRFVGSEASMEVKSIQERFNMQSRTAVYRRMAWGLFPHGNRWRGMASLDTWEELKSIPLHLIGGETDVVTKISNITSIMSALHKKQTQRRQPEAVLSGDSSSSNGDFGLRDDISDSESSDSNNSDPRWLRPDAPWIIKTPHLASILPSPAPHGLLYDSTNSHLVFDLIHTFLSTHIDRRLSLDWQRQRLSEDQMSGPS